MLSSFCTLWEGPRRVKLPFPPSPEASALASHPGLHRLQSGWVSSGVGVGSPSQLPRVVAGSPEQRKNEDPV